MTNTKKLRKFMEYSQEQLARLLGVSRSTVAMWETTQQEPDYETVRRMSMIFNVSSDFVMGSGIFSKWDQIIEYYNPVVYKLMELIPPTLEMPTFSDEKFLTAWLDTRLYSEPDEIQLARWFAFAIKDIEITPREDTPHGDKDADVEVEFTPEFEALILATEKREGETKEKPTPEDGGGPDHNVIRLAGRDGTYVERELTDEQVMMMRAMLDQLKPVDDERI